jgi:hypothetical protein
MGLSMRLFCASKSSDAGAGAERSSDDELIEITKLACIGLVREALVGLRDRASAAAPSHAARARRSR